MASLWFPGNGKHLTDPFSELSCTHVCGCACEPCVCAVCWPGMRSHWPQMDNKQTKAGDSRQQVTAAAGGQQPAAFSPFSSLCISCSFFVAQFVRGKPINSEPSAAAAAKCQRVVGATTWRLRTAALQHAAYAVWVAAKQLVRVLLWQRDV